MADANPLQCDQVIQRRQYDAPVHFATLDAQHAPALLIAARSCQHQRFKGAGADDQPVGEIAVPNRHTAFAAAMEQQRMTIGLAGHG
jgi:hypothetical protein